MPPAEGVRIQGSGYRPGVSAHEPEPSISEVEKYHRLLNDAKERTVILYSHGGFYWRVPSSEYVPSSRAILTSLVVQVAQQEAGLLRPN